MLTMKWIIKQPQFMLSMSLNVKTISLTLEHHEVICITALLLSVLAGPPSVSCEDNPGDERNRQQQQQITSCGIWCTYLGKTQVHRTGTVESQGGERLIYFA